MASWTTAVTWQQPLFNSVNNDTTVVPTPWTSVLTNHYFTNTVDISSGGRTPIATLGVSKSQTF